MAIAVTEAGGLGSLACATLGAVELRSAIEAILEGSSGAINVNFFAHGAPLVVQARHRDWLRRLSRYFRELGATPPAELVGGPVRAFDGEHCGVLEELKPRITTSPALYRLLVSLSSHRIVCRLGNAGTTVIATDGAPDAVV